MCFNLCLCVAFFVLACWMHYVSLVVAVCLRCVAVWLVVGCVLSACVLLLGCLLIGGCLFVDCSLFVFAVWLLVLWMFIGCVLVVCWLLVGWLCVCVCVAC